MNTLFVGYIIQVPVIYVVLFWKLAEYTSGHKNLHTIVHWLHKIDIQQNLSNGYKISQLDCLNIHELLLNNDKYM